MGAVPKIYQGSNKVLQVQTNIDLTGAIEIEVRVDTPSQIIKTLSNGDISNVTSSQFEVTFVPGDTESVASGDYLYQVVATDSQGRLIQGKFFPNKLTIVDSVFVNAGRGNDYN